MTTPTQHPFDTKPSGDDRFGRKLRRSRDERMIAGVCGGAAEYLGVDPVLVRLAFVALTVFAGSGALLYLAAWILIPEADASGS